MTDWMARFRAASALLVSVRDIVDERPDGALAPAWCVHRGWDSFLSALTPAALVHAERAGLARAIVDLPAAPPDLVVLAAAVRAAVALAEGASDGGADAVAARRASPRKRAQVAAFAKLVVRSSPAASRVVDAGAGHGHLTRHLAAALGVSAEGWERDPARVVEANRLTHDRHARFRTLDVGLAGAELRAGDVVVGLHACGALGDAVVRAASDAGAGVALIGCCLQKRDGARPPLARVDGVDARAFVLDRAILGLGNARDGEEGVEDDLATRARARCARVALRALLREQGALVAPGEEMRGVNRRRATGELGDFVARAFRARGLPAPDPARVAEAGAAAVVAHDRERRFSLPRTMLARLVEVWVALDRSMFLVERGYDVELVCAFPEAISPRNVALLARPPSAAG